MTLVELEAEWPGVQIICTEAKSEDCGHYYIEGYYHLAATYNDHRLVTACKTGDGSSLWKSKSAAHRALDIELRVLRTALNREG